jgi:hypothetical protein
MVRRKGEVTLRMRQRHYRYRYDLLKPPGGWGRERFALLHGKAQEIAPDRQAYWATTEQPEHTAFIFLFEAERDRFREWVDTCGVDWSEPNWLVVRS